MNTQTSFAADGGTQVINPADIPVGGTTTLASFFTNPDIEIGGDLQVKDGFAVKPPSQDGLDALVMFLKRPDSRNDAIVAAGFDPLDVIAEVVDRDYVAARDSSATPAAYWIVPGALQTRGYRDGHECVNTTDFVAVRIH